MPQTKESFLKGRTTQFLIEQLRCKGLTFYDENGHDIVDYGLQRILDWKTGMMREVVIIRDNSQTPRVFWEYTLGEIKDELDKRPHISHHRERRKQHRFPENKRKK